MGGVLGNECESLAGSALQYRGTTRISTSPETHPLNLADMFAVKIIDINLK